MKELILDGRFLAQTVTGVQRVAYELLKQFAEMPIHVIVAMPPDGAEPQLLSDHIEYVRIGKKSGTRWEQVSLVKFCKKKKLPLLCTGNIAPVFYRSNVILHDVFYLDYPSEERWIRQMRVMARSYIYRNRNLFTDSEFSKSRILANYPKMKREPVVVFVGHEHVFSWEEEPIENLPERFYLAVGSVSPHKNFKYILALAKNNPERNFVVTGKLDTSYEKYLKENDIKNCTFTGYVTDGNLKWLYQRCEGFLLPSLYEGFGLPPLEAIACGCRKIFLSDIPVFREVYGDCANFFDPNDYENTVCLDVDNGSEEAFRDLLFRHRWEKTAEKILDAIHD